MVMQEFVHNFNGFFSFPSRCHVRILNDEDKPFVVICSQGINQGTSITNDAEKLRAQIEKKLLQEGFSLLYECKKYLKN